MELLDHILLIMWCHQMKPPQMTVMGFEQPIHVAGRCRRAVASWLLM